MTELYMDSLLRSERDAVHRVELLIYIRHLQAQVQRD